MWLLLKTEDQYKKESIEDNEKWRSGFSAENAINNIQKDMHKISKGMQKIEKACKTSVDSIKEKINGN